MRADITVRRCAFGQESQDDLLEETFLEWRALGPAAAWQAMYDILGWWFTVRGLDPETQQVERTHIEIHKVPWSQSGSETTRLA
jgi:hypothetical protein